MPSYVITGAARGLGYGLVAELARRPSTQVFGLVRDTSTADDLNALAKKHDNVHVLPGDVTKPKELNEAAKHVSSVTGGSLDVLIHNANGRDMSAMYSSPSMLSLDDAEGVKKMFEHEFEVSFYGAIFVTNAFLPLIEHGDQKKIVHISSPFGEMEFTKVSGATRGLPYSVAKAAMNLMTSKYAAELKDKGIKALALSPGYVNTTPKGQPPPSPQLIAAVEEVEMQFRHINPTLTGPMTVEESVRHQLKVIDKLDEEMSGKLLSHFGDRQWF